MIELQNVILMLTDETQVVVPYKNVKDLVNTYSIVRDKCYEFKLFIKVSAKEEEMLEKCTCQFVGFEYEDEIEALKVPFKNKDGVNVCEKVWKTEDGWLGMQFKPVKEGR